MPGLVSRWTEHVRELATPLNGNVLAYRRRNRYDDLADKRCGPGAGILAVLSSGAQGIAKAEALAIAVAAPSVNGAQFKNLAHQARQ